MLLSMSTPETPQSKEPLLKTIVMYIVVGIATIMWIVNSVLLWVLPVAIYLLSIFLAFFHHAPAAIKVGAFVPCIGQLVMLFYMFSIRGLMNIFTLALIVYAIALWQKSILDPPVQRERPHT